ncbi:MAG: sirohydrochlorin chelatase [Elainellaceae cyanobacterium]
MPDPTAFPSDAYLLVSHGSRDPRPAIAADQLAQNLTQRAAHPIIIATAALEFADRPLHQQILQLCDRLPANSVLHIVPLFLLSGVHVREDVPGEVELAQRQTDVSLHLTPHLGRSPLMPATLEQLFQTHGVDSASGRILLSHGSRRPGGNQDAIALAEHLGARLAYWSIEPHLAAQVAHFVHIGQRNITVVPYFLFPGGITDAIAQQVAQLQATYANVEITMTPILSESAGFAALVAESTGLSPAPVSQR